MVVPVNPKVFRKAIHSVIRLNQKAMTSQSLIVLYQEMSDHTSPECANSCRIPRSCCDRMYCDMAGEQAKKDGVSLEPTGHPTLPYMGPGGCVVPPHLRPLCTIHTCDVNRWGCKPGDDGWTTKYFKIRDELDRLEAEECRW